ncbi:MAG TPA: ferredoxin [Pyrodictiaceae archaeon]|nr:ferredoxin [Pyrodictiaceae archaeon]HIP85338.1 ferredoxin [Pyrodictium sp.]HIQ11107.1 ferredoxin [Pyrodictium sp.]HIQ56325.1 ferredoxin [Pyrodictium sp.]
MAKKIKVRVDRDQCIADMVCVSLCPDVFEMNEEDGKVQIKAQFRVDQSNLSEGIVPADLEECVKAASEACPVAIIHVEEVKE